MEKLEDLNMTQDEFNRISEAMKKEEFRKLLIEYCEEISDPANRKIYEDEIRQLESQRGVDCQFVHPKPGFVVKTTNETEKVFVNIASNDLVEKPSCKRQTRDGAEGVAWSIPLLQAPPRKDVDNMKNWCYVYDVIFHPNSLQLAEKDSRFREMLVNTALDAVMNNFDVPKLDRKNLKFPKMPYKGTPKPTVLRKKGDESKIEDMGPLKDIMPSIKNPQKEKIVVPKVEIPEYTTPKYTIKYRKGIEMHEFTGALDAKMTSSIPKEIVVDVHLPQLKSSNDLDLDVSANRLTLCNEKPKYKLELNLAYSVDDKNGTAKFDSDKKILSVTLPVVQPKIGVQEITEKTSKLIEEIDEVIPQVQESERREESDEEEQGEEEFFLQNQSYEIPKFLIESYDSNFLTLIFEAQNILQDSVEIKIKPDEINLKFSTVGSGFFELSHGIIISIEDDKCLKGDWIFKNSILKLQIEVEGNLTEKSGIIFGLNELEYREIGELLKVVQETSEEEEKPLVEEIVPVSNEFIQFESRLCKLVK